jgi:hypothetical protein
MLQNLHFNFSTPHHPYQQNHTTATVLITPPNNLTSPFLSSAPTIVVKRQLAQELQAQQQS